MTNLNLGPMGLAIGGPGGDESDVTIKRWVLKLLLPVAIVLFGFGYSWIDRRFIRLETAPSTNVQVELMSQRLDAVEKMIRMYEELRMVRERQIARLEEQNKTLKETMDNFRSETNAKLDRLLFGRRAVGP